MKHKAVAQFWKARAALPAAIKKLADANYVLLKHDPRHPSIQFKKVGRFWSVRIGLRYRDSPSKITASASGSGSDHIQNTTV